jgi:DNA-binding protein HU-beta
MGIGRIPLNKNDLVSAVADSANITRADAAKAVDAVFDTITSTLKTGDEVRLVGFGTFATSKRAASTGRNPRTGETIEIASSVQPKFKAGKGLKDALNGA